MTNFEWYRTFKTIYECDSISEAAKKLFMTQPGVSKHLSALEARTGKKLFIRTARKILPTEFGKFLYTQIIASVEGLEGVEKSFSKNSANRCPSIVVGCRHDLFEKIILPQLPDLKMAVTVHFGAPVFLAEALEKGKIDLLVGTDKYNNYPHVFSKLQNEELVLVASNNVVIPEEIMKSTKEDRRLLKWLKDQNWFAFDNELSFTVKYWEHNFNKRPQVTAAIVFSSFSGIIATMKRMNGLCIMPLNGCEEALQNNEIKLILPHLNVKENQLFCSHKTSGENLYEIRLFKEKINFPL